MDKSLWYLENAAVESILCPNKLKDSHDHHGLLTFKKGETIFTGNRNIEYIYYIVKGRVLIGTYRDQDRNMPTAILQKGDIFGQLPMLDDPQREDYAIANDDLELCAMSVTDMKSMMKDHTMFNMLMMRMMGSRVLEMEKRLESLLFKDSRTRIIEFILNSVEKNGQRIGYEWMIRNFNTHQEVADLTATSRQTVTMILNELRNENTIHFDRKRLLIRDLDKLKSYVPS
jgi:CRP/FNR family transcriptional regulator, cyclic AMP receptor protein